MSTTQAAGERSSTPEQDKISESTIPATTSTSEGETKPVTPPKPKEDQSEEQATQEEGEADERSANEAGIEPTSSKPLVPARALGEESSRQVIAVSASKGPAAFFNLARKFLVTDEECDLSALEGAIVSAVDAAHLLERSKLATIVRVHTSYVTVEPKKKRAASMPEEPEPGSQTSSAASAEAPPATEGASPQVAPMSPSTQGGSQNPPQETAPSSERSHGGRSAGGRELRRARIVITVRRSESYKQWLEENPLQAIIASDADEADPLPSAKDP